MLDLDPIAAHEAAHAVVAHFYGCVVTLVNCAPTATYSGKSCADTSNATRIAELLIALAGREAQCRVDPSARAFGDWHPDWKYDSERAYKHAESLIFKRHGRRPATIGIDEIESLRTSKRTERLISLAF